MRKILLFAILVHSFAISYSQYNQVCTTTYFANGEFDAYIAGGGLAGANISVLTAPNTTYGATSANSLYRLADDFTVSGPNWTPSAITVYAYQTGSGNTSTLTGVPYLALWTSTPTTGGSAAYVSASNTLIATVWTNVYRVLSSATNSNQRPIMAISVLWPASFPATLTPGTYWLEFGITGSGASGPFTPPSSVGGGNNAMQYTVAGGTWASVTDLGSGAFMDFPFRICQTGPIPISLISFRGNANKKTVTLDWSTSQEFNNKGFDIEKSLTGTGFSKVGYVDGHGNSNVVRTYRTSMFQVEAEAFYRLRQIDINGNFTYSDVVKIRTADDGKVFIYPVPASDFVTMVITPDYTGSRVCVMTDVNGKKIRQFTCSAASNKIDISNLQSGIYFIHMHGIVMKFIKVE